jgi:hypothetical protein
MKLKRRYEYRLSVPDVKDFILGHYDVPYPFDADDYFPKYFNENSLSVLNTLDVDSADTDPKTATRLSRAIIADWIDGGGILSAKRLDTGKETVLLQNDKDDPEKCTGRRFTYECLFDGKFNYDGNIASRLRQRITDSITSLLIHS